MNSSGTIVHVGDPTSESGRGGRSYQKRDVIYRDDKDQVRTKSLRSFVNPEVFNSVGDFEEGDTIYFVTEKDDKGYWQWLQVSKTPFEEPETKGPAASGAGKSYQNRNYESEEERTRRQLFIIRQSSFDKGMTLAGENPTFAKVIKQAEQIEAWVMRGYKVNDDDTVSRVDDEDVPQ